MPKLELTVPDIPFFTMGTRARCYHSRARVLLFTHFDSGRPHDTVFECPFLTTGTRARYHHSRARVPLFTHFDSGRPHDTVSECPFLTTGTRARCHHSRARVPLFTHFDSGSVIMLIFYNGHACPLPSFACPRPIIYTLRLGQTT